MSDLEERMLELLDKQELHELQVRYCHGVDLQDRQLLLSVYHEDAIDAHPGFGKGSPEEFANWVIREDNSTRRIHSQHTVVNELYTIEGDKAWGECYTMGRNAWTGEGQAFGRYLDRYERRDGEWRIHRRLCVVEWAPPGGGFDSQVYGFRGKDDPSYILRAKGDPVDAMPDNYARINLS